jgi:hypothetical protein
MYPLVFQSPIWPASIIQASRPGTLRVIRSLCTGSARSFSINFTSSADSRNTEDPSVCSQRRIPAMERRMKVMSWIINSSREGRAFSVSDREKVKARAAKSKVWRKSKEASPDIEPRERSQWQM